MLTMPACRVAVVDDKEQQIDRIKTLVLNGWKQFEHLLPLAGDSPDLEGRSDSTALADEIASGYCPYNAIIADVFMPAIAGGPAVADGGAKRIYSALRNSGLLKKVLLIIITNVGTEGFHVIDQLMREAEQEGDWVQFVPKSESMPLEKTKQTVMTRDRTFGFLICRALSTLRNLVADAPSTWVGIDYEHVEPGMLERITGAEIAARQERVLLLDGEFGTGKAALAKKVHEWSSRNGAFTQYPCTRLTVASVKSLVFGAVRDESGPPQLQPGLLADYPESTIYFSRFDADEGVASKLSDALGELIETKFRYTHVGGTREKVFNGGFIIGTRHFEGIRASLERGFLAHVDTAQARINLPSLRDRRDDIEVLARAFAQRRGKKVLPAALAALQRCSWPDNIFQLEQVIERCSEERLAETTIDERTVERFLPEETLRRNKPGRPSNSPQKHLNRLVLAAMTVGTLEFARGQDFMSLSQTVKDKLTRWGVIAALKGGQLTNAVKLTAIRNRLRDDGFPASTVTLQRALQYVQENAAQITDTISSELEASAETQRKLLNTILQGTRPAGRVSASEIFETYVKKALIDKLSSVLYPQKQNL